VCGQSQAPAALPLGNRPGINFRGGWVGLLACLEGCRKSRPNRDSIAGPSLSSFLGIFLHKTQLATSMLALKNSEEFLDQQGCSLPCQRHRRFNTAFSSDPGPDQPSPCPQSNILKIYFNLCLGLPSGLFPPVVPTHLPSSPYMPHPRPSS
jgi:hypothetical protein